MTEPDADAARPYLREQTRIEEANRMQSFEFFVDDLDDPKNAVLLECFRDDASQAAHMENIRLEQLSSVFANFRIHVYGNPPRSVRDRMHAAGFWPPAFEGEFTHMPYFMGFRG